MTGHLPRYAIYFSPRPESALGIFGRGVLGRDATSNAEAAIFPPLERHFSDWARKVAPAAHYGFHATLKPPFELAAGVEDPWVREDVRSLAKDIAPVSLGHLRVASIGQFIALVPISPPAQLGALAARIVRSLDPLRAPLSEDDRARRRPDALSARQVEYLDLWGYPYVFDEFRFHMTLTGPLTEAERQTAESVLNGLYQSFDQPVSISEISLFIQPDRNAPFTMAERYRLSG